MYCRRHFTGHAEQGILVLIKNFAMAAATAAAMVALAFSPASARQWKATPEALARDYATINDSRPDGELVVLLWFVPQMIRPDTPGASAATAMLKKYVMLMVVDGHVDKTTGTISFQDVNALEARDQNGKTLDTVARDSLPPANVAVVTAVEALFRQSFGAMGKGMKLFVFDSDGVDPCGKGRLSVAVADETYTWDTPFPSCQAK
jgi:hypothetical protein